MNAIAPAEFATLPAAARADRLALAQRRLEQLSAGERVQWALGKLPGSFILSSSFGIQAAVSLHLVSRYAPHIPVVLIDTGYLFPETHAFARALTDRLGLNLHVYGPEHAPAAFEARYGRLWETGVAGIERYNTIMKVTPMRRALAELRAGTWFAGLRREQSRSRSNAPIVEFKDGRFKVYPIADWNNRDVHRYLEAHDLPYHPLWEQGYVSVGDVHTSRPLSAGMSEEDTRFFGLKRECGLHE
ncbi:MAG: phosphoadenylyl-sulfate reductase [Gammaproteobacteria bacterium]|nr:phosphoadenylyl-sulfate reductase [Gammaproteobacteria bacterium]